MSEQRWAVLGDAARNGWLVVHPGDVCRMSDGRLECWAVHSRHDTWTEAMQEADRMARTVTFTLPADPDRHAPYRGAVASSEAPAQYQFGGPDGDWSNKINLEAAQITPFALALLVHARRLA